MGGCRCTYRNCSVKSDGKTHMFHYPVFDKVRCHQWLINAQRLDFLDLKVSQLKNRCVCQHHFKDENFMNYKKDKLTFDAIPSEDGPFCDPSKYVELDECKEYPNIILLEDIENDLNDVNDRKSNFSVKYGDFLTNSEFMDSSARFNRKNINLSNENTVMNINSCLMDDKTLHVPRNIKPLKHIKKPTLPILEDKHRIEAPPLPMLEEKHIIKTPTLPMLVDTQILKAPPQPMIVVPYSDFSNELKMGKELSVDQNVIDLDLKLLPPDSLNLDHQNAIPCINIIRPQLELDNSTPVSNNPTCIKAEPKVRILSEREIKSPVTVTGKFEKVSPSFTLTLPIKSSITESGEPEITLIRSVTSPNKPSDKLKVLEVLDVEFDPLQNNRQKKQDKTEKTTERSPLKKSIQIKNKVTPERSAAIEEKRKFNLKLKDIIESCLDKLDDPVKNDESFAIPKPDLGKPNPPNKRNLNLMENLTIQETETQADSVPAKGKSLPSAQEYTIAYLDARMKKMESNLLDKIEQNSQKIMDIKKSWTDDLDKYKELPNSKRCISTQTNSDEESYKRYLYQEISKYVNPSTNSIIFEELFIDKFACKAVKSPLKRKRRKFI